MDLCPMAVCLLANSPRPDDGAKIRRIFVTVGKVIQFLMETLATMWANFMLRKKDVALSNYIKEMAFRHKWLFRNSPFFEQQELLPSRDPYGSS